MKLTENAIGPEVCGNSGHGVSLILRACYMLRHVMSHDVCLCVCLGLWLCHKVRHKAQ